MMTLQEEIFWEQANRKFSKEDDWMNREELMMGA